MEKNRLNVNHLVQTKLLDSDISSEDVDSFCDQYYLISPREDICLSEDLSFSTNLRENILSEVKRIGGVPKIINDKGD